MSVQPAATIPPETPVDRPAVALVPAAQEERVRGLAGRCAYCNWNCCRPLLGAYFLGGAILGFVKGGETVAENSLSASVFFVFSALYLGLSVHLLYRSCQAHNRY